MNTVDDSKRCAAGRGGAVTFSAAVCYVLRASVEPQGKGKNSLTKTGLLYNGRGMPGGETAVRQFLFSVETVASALNDDIIPYSFQDGAVIFDFHARTT